MITETEKRVYDFDTIGVTCARHEHLRLYGEEASQYWKGIEGRHCKNLFLRNNKGNRHYLVVLEQSKKVDL